MNRDEDDAGSSGSCTSKSGKPNAVERRRRDSHNEFERRRRDQINSKLTELKLLVPSLSNLVSNKATVLSKAIDYITQLANENTRANYHIHQLSTENTKAMDVINQLNDENSELRAQIEVLRIGLSQKQAPGTKDGTNKRPRKDEKAPPALCVPDEVLKQFVASSLALTTRSLVVADGTDPQMPVIYASLGFQLMTGYSQEEILGRNCNFLQGRNTSPLTRNVIRNALREKQEVLVEILNYKKDGTPFWNLLFITPVLDPYGNVTHFVGLQFDITETKCASKENLLNTADYMHNPRAETFGSDSSVLYVPNETLKHLIASALRLIMRNLVVTDPKQSGNPIIYCTPGVCQMTQYSKEEILGRNGGFLQGPGSDSITKAQIGKALRESRECLAEMLNYRKDGTPFWNLMFITPILDSFGKPNLFIGIEYDITLR
uniref:Putative LOV domain-containing protein n=1 Tax=Glaucocystis sp. BC-2016 TaxID=1802912 RepID=A0A126X0L0_9EUKA|nr:putative LOV domain-containing protein [Glaucocystis sp. BC-2016]